MFDVWSSRAHCSGMPCAETALGLAVGCRGASEYEWPIANRRNSQWTPQWRHQSQRVWCVQSLKAEKSPVAPCPDPSSYHLRKKTRMLMLLQNKLIINGSTLRYSEPQVSEMTGAWLSSHFFRLQKRLRWFCSEVFAPRAQTAAVWSCGWPRGSLCRTRCWRWCCSCGPEGRGVYPQSRRYRTSLEVVQEGGERRAHWATTGRGTAWSQTDRVADRGCETALTSAWGTGVIMQRPEVAPDDQSRRRVAPSAPGAISDVKTKKSIKAFLPNGACMWCKVIWKWHFQAYRLLGRTMHLKRLIWMDASIHFWTCT